MSGTFDINEIKRRMQAGVQALKHELGGLRTGRASGSMLIRLRTSSRRSMCHALAWLFFLRPDFGSAG